MTGAKIFDPAWFDAQFWKTANKGVDRNPDHGRYFTTAVQIYKTLGDSLADSARVLEAGCGQGAVMRHLQNLAPRWDIHGFDVSEYAVANKVHPNVQHSNILNFSTDIDAELVYCVGVLEYLEPKDVPAALASLARWSTRFVVLGLQPTDHKFMPQSYLEASGRLTFENKAWWEGQITQAGLFVHPGLTSALYEGVNQWDGMYVCTKTPIHN